MPRVLLLFLSSLMLHVYLSAGVNSGTSVAIVIDNLEHHVGANHESMPLNDVFEGLGYTVIPVRLGTKRVIRQAFSAYLELLNEDVTDCVFAWQGPAFQWRGKIHLVPVGAKQRADAILLDEYIEQIEAKGVPFNLVLVDPVASSLVEVEREGLAAVSAPKDFFIGYSVGVDHPLSGQPDGLCSSEDCVDCEASRSRYTISLFTYELERELRRQYKSGQSLIWADAFRNIRKFVSYKRCDRQLPFYADNSFPMDHVETPVEDGNSTIVVGGVSRGVVPDSPTYPLYRSDEAPDRFSPWGYILMILVMVVWVVARMLSTHKTSSLGPRPCEPHLDSSQHSVGHQQKIPLKVYIEPAETSKFSRLLKKQIEGAEWPFYLLEVRPGENLEEIRLKHICDADIVLLRLVPEFNASEKINEIKEQNPKVRIFAVMERYGSYHQPGIELLHEKVFDESSNDSERERFCAETLERLEKKLRSVLSDSGNSGGCL